MIIRQIEDQAEQGIMYPLTSIVLHRLIQLAMHNDGTDIEPAGGTSKQWMDGVIVIFGKFYLYYNVPHESSTTKTVTL